MRKFLAALMLVACNAFALQPADVSINADPAVTVNVLPRAKEQPIMSITVNPQDHVMVNGTMKYPVNHHGGIVVSDPSTWFSPHVGASDFRTHSYTPVEPIVGIDGGNVRTTCMPAWRGFIDPIVYPGKVGFSHFHVGFGNTGLNENSTHASLLASGNSTCRGGIMNRSAYWVPGMIDTAHGNVPIEPDRVLIYYKNENFNYFAPGSVMHVLPEGLTMITGDATTAAPGGNGNFICLKFPEGVDRDGSHQEIPTTCQTGDQIWMQIYFGQCLAVDTAGNPLIDSPDHKSHVSGIIDDLDHPQKDPTNGNTWYYKACPADHPYAIPAITLKVMYNLPANPTDTKNWRLASDAYQGPGGYSRHADYIEAWDPKSRIAWGTNCNIGLRDCGSFTLGNGTAADEFDGN